MSFTVENLENNRAKLTIEVAADAFEKAVQQAYEKQKGKIQINGFRKGKAPRQMIEKLYGAGVFFEDAANILIPEEYAKAADESKLDIVSQPEIDVTQIEKGKAFIFTATVDLKPVVTLGQYLGVEIEKVDTKVTADDVKAELEKVRDQNSRLIDVTDRAVKNGDRTIVDFEGSVEGENFEGGTATDFPLEIGSHSFVDTFEEQLIGAEIGKEVEVNITFPADYAAENLAGKKALFKVTVKAIKAKELPELNDDFAKDVSEFETLAEYKKDIKKNLTEKKAEAAKKEKQVKAVAKAVENASMEIPEGMIKLQVNNIVNDFAQRLQMQGLSIEQYIQYMGATPAQFMDSLKPEAETRIKNSLVLEAIVEAENITVTDDEVEKEIAKMAEDYKMEIDKIKDMLNEAQIEQIKGDLTVNKAAELIASTAVEVDAVSEDKAE